LVLGVFVLALILLIVILIVVLSGDSGTGSGATSTVPPSETTSTSLTAASFSAQLTGDQSVPSVTTNAKANFEATFDPETSVLSFSLELFGLTNPSVAKIYEGTPGTTGIPVYTLFAGPTVEGLYSGVISDGIVDETGLTGSLIGMTVGDLVAMMAAGDAYVSVGNTSHPEDAIRGQIE